MGRRARTGHHRRAKPRRARIGGHQSGALSFDWSETSDAVLTVASGARNGSALAFSPATLPPGPYTLAVTVQRSVGDYTSPVSSVELSFLVLADGSTASVADADRDGVPDSGDGADARAGLAHELESGSGGRMQAEPGVRLQVGATQSGSARVTLQDLAEHGNGRGESVGNAEDEFDYPGGILDFEVANLPEAGASVRVVVPLGMGIGELAEYRKFQPERGWGDFVEDERNALASAPGARAARRRAMTPTRPDSRPATCACSSRSRTAARTTATRRSARTGWSATRAA